MIADILGAAPGVKVLATSRERLQLQAESVYALTGLDLPDDTADAATLESNNAVKLYLQGARRIQPGWKPAADDLRQIARICRMVDGLPLAIVLAAGWMQTLSAAEIEDELSRSIDILESDLRDVPERHRSMRAVFDTSWQTISDDERTLMMRLSVFRGDCHAAPRRQSPMPACARCRLWCPSQCCAAIPITAVITFTNCCGSTPKAA
ncbi:MAG: hypothetical protein HND48_16745 [Chloroflexi bacterium]|nr:hypothetical protein [Chloroflexota bacterium]